MSTPTIKPPRFINLDHVLCDPSLTRTSQLATFHLPEGARVEVAICDALRVVTSEGPRLEMHRLLVSRPARRELAIIQLRDLAELNGMPEVLRALEHFEAGRFKDAARYAAAAGPRWRGLVDFFGGPA